MYKSPRAEVFAIHADSTTVFNSSSEYQKATDNKTSPDEFNMVGETKIEDTIQIKDSPFESEHALRNDIINENRQHTIIYRNTYPYEKCNTDF